MQVLKQFCGHLITWGLIISGAARKLHKGGELEAWNCVWILMKFFPPKTIFSSNFANYVKQSCPFFGSKEYFLGELLGKSLWEPPPLCYAPAHYSDNLFKWELVCIYFCNLQKNLQVTNNAIIYFASIEQKYMWIQFVMNTDFKALIFVVLLMLLSFQFHIQHPLIYHLIKTWHMNFKTWSAITVDCRTNMDWVDDGHNNSQ